MRVLVFVHNNSLQLHSTLNCHHLHNSLRREQSGKRLALEGRGWRWKNPAKVDVNLKLYTHAEFPSPHDPASLFATDNAFFFTHKIMIM